MEVTDKELKEMHEDFRNHGEKIFELKPLRVKKTHKRRRDGRINGKFSRKLCRLFTWK